MANELARIQVITLGSIIVLAGLCLCLIGLVWVLLNLSEIVSQMRCLGGGPLKEFTPEARRHGGAVQDADYHGAEGFQPFQLVRVVQELNWIGGSGQIVPVGSLIRLISTYDTTAGRRWSGSWGTCYLSSIPEDMLAPLWQSSDAPQVTAFAEPQTVPPAPDGTLPRCEREFLIHQHNHSAG